MQNHRLWPSPCVVSSCRVISGVIMSCVISGVIMSHVISGVIMSCHHWCHCVMSYLVSSCHVISGVIMSCHIWRHHVVSSPVSSCHVSSLVSSCHVSSLVSTCVISGIIMSRVISGVTMRHLWRHRVVRRRFQSSDPVVGRKLENLVLDDDLISTANHSNGVMQPASPAMPVCESRGHAVDLISRSDLVVSSCHVSSLVSTCPSVSREVTLLTLFHVLT